MVCTCARCPWLDESVYSYDPDDCMTAKAYLTVVEDHITYALRCCWSLLVTYNVRPIVLKFLIYVWFENHGSDIKYFFWPPNSPNLNPVQYIWWLLLVELVILHTDTTEGSIDAEMDVYTNEKFKPPNFLHGTSRTTNYLLIRWAYTHNKLGRILYIY